jgi:hypothetical protein
VLSEGAGQHVGASGGLHSEHVMFLNTMAQEDETWDGMKGIAHLIQQSLVQQQFNSYRDI